MLKRGIDFTCEAAQVYLVNQGLKSVFNFVLGKNESGSSFENVDMNFQSLMVREEDVKKEISIKLQEGSRKRKREVEVWLEDMKKIKEEYPRFVEEEEGKGFMKRMLGGDEALTKMNERIRDLDNRSRLFGELVLAAAIFPEVSAREAVSRMNGSERDEAREAVSRMLTQITAVIPYHSYHSHHKYALIKALINEYDSYSTSQRSKWSNIIRDLAPVGKRTRVS